MGKTWCNVKISSMGLAEDEGDQETKSQFHNYCVFLVHNSPVYPDYKGLLWLSERNH